MLATGLDLFALLLASMASLWLTNNHLHPPHVSDLLLQTLTLREVLIAILLLFVWSGMSQQLGSVNASLLLPVNRLMHKALTFATLSCIGFVLAAFVGSTSLKPRAILFFWVSSAMVLSLVRLLLYFIVRPLQHSLRRDRRVLIVGTCDRCAQAAKVIESNIESPATILGFVDDPWPGLTAFQSSSRYPVVTDLKGFGAYIEQHVVDEVIVGLPLASLYKEAARIVCLAEGQGLVVRCLTGIFDARSAPGDWAGTINECVLVSSSKAVGHSSVAGKRVLDVLLSTLALIVLTPPFLLIAIAIKLTSPGSVLFTQQRAGLNKRMFRIYKFRTMVKNAEAMLEQVVHLNEETGPAFKIKNDPRITPLGRVLRKTSLDELPQLWNVLKGDMSLVGPRPLFSWEYQRMEDQSEKRRFCIKPGLTGLWQVSGRSNVTFAQRIQMDLAYIDNWSLALDWKLLLKTVPVVLFRKGAV